MTQTIVDENSINNNLKEPPNDNLIRIFNHIVGFLSVSGGITFIIGSIVYMPSIANDFNPNLGGILFIIGSAFFFFCDLIGAILEPKFSPFKPLANIGSLRALCIMLGNISFIIGSVYFLSFMPATVGCDIFVIASIFIWIPQILTCFGLYICNSFTAAFYYELLSHRKMIVNVNILLAIACLFFFVGSILFQDQNSETLGLYQQGVVMFIIGSLFFFLAAVAGVYMRNTMNSDPMQIYRHKMKELLTGMTNSSMKKQLLDSLKNEKKVYWEALGF